MAPRQAAEEIFTDLSGQPDKGVPGDEAEALERALVTQGGDDDKIPDDELKVVDDEEEDGPGDADEEGDGEGDEDEEEEVRQDPINDFDPGQVDILVKDAEILDLKEKNATSDKARAEADIATATAAMEVAQDAGDTKANIEATKKYTAATIALQTATNDLTAIGGAKAALGTRAKALYAKAPKDAEGNPILDGKKPAAGKTPVVTKEAKWVPKFKSANAWFNNEKYKKQTARLIQIDKGLAAEETLDRNSPEYALELGKRFTREFPGLFRTPDGKPIATGERRRGSGPRIPDNGGGGGGGGNAGTKVSLTNADLVTMRQFGMDPADMNHRRSFLSEKRAMAQSSQGRA